MIFKYNANLTKIGWVWFGKGGKAGYFSDFEKGSRRGAELTEEMQ